VLVFTLLALSAQSLTDIQIIGSHNSYHAGIAPSEMVNLKKSNARLAASLDYTHPPLREQLEMGVRKFELDIFSDSKGGLFADPAGPRLVAKAGLPADPPFDPEGRMKKPGYKVIHVQDLDYRSTCQPLVECLTILRDWSKEHPRHLPIYVMLETKTGNPRPEFMATPEPITVASLDALDAEIRGVFEARHLITPDVVRGNARTLEEAVLTKGWPSLESARGKIIFLFDQENITKLYTQGRPSLEGRVVFTNGTPGSADAAFVKMNDPKSPRIAELVKLGYLVRTRSDVDGVSSKEAALASGAQIVSSDYYFGKKAPAGFTVDFGKGIARCNPVRAKACKAADLVE
jgi:hypothetical protein